MVLLLLPLNESSPFWIGFCLLWCVLCVLSLRCLCVFCDGNVFRQSRRAALDSGYPSRGGCESSIYRLHHPTSWRGGGLEKRNLCLVCFE